MDLVELDKLGLNVTRLKPPHLQYNYKGVDINYHKSESDDCTYATSATKGINFCLSDENFDSLDQKVRSAINFLWDYRDKKEKGSTNEAKRDSSK